MGPGLWVENFWFHPYMHKICVLSIYMVHAAKNSDSRVFIVCYSELTQSVICDVKEQNQNLTTLM